MKNLNLDVNQSHNFSTSFVVDQSPEKVFSAINDVRGWWSDVEGSTLKASDRFTHQVMGLHRCEINVTELVLGKLVLWTVIDNHFSFTKDKTEWKYTNIVFEISQVKSQTLLKFTHIGLVPEYECYEICVDGWQTYIDSLYSLITTGRGNPNVGEAKTKSEHKLAAMNNDQK